jgi:DNA-binding response OmpR family regulator
VGLLVYIVDDDVRLSRLLALLLEIEGFEAVTFTSGWDFLARLEAESAPHAVVLDLMMPDIDGREVYQRARALGYRGPILILSAFGARQAQRELGAEDSMAKPFEPESLVKRVRMLVATP